MKNIIFYLGILTFLSCKSKVDTTEPNKPQLDFTQTKFYTIDEILKCAIQEACGKSHYWEGKSLNIQGYVSYVDKNKRIFTLHSALDYGASTTTSLNVKINSIDSVAIAAKVNGYLDKKCFVKAVCISTQFAVANCQESLIPEVSSANDIDIK